MTPLVATSPGQISISFSNRASLATFKVQVSGGPTTVTDFQFSLDANGSGTATIPPNGTSSSLAAGTYQVKITSQPDGGLVFNSAEEVLGGGATNLPGH
jgi:hypothetical protein